jgi:hypothetical protein
VKKWRTTRQLASAGKAEQRGWRKWQGSEEEIIGGAPPSRGLYLHLPTNSHSSNMSEQQESPRKLVPLPGAINSPEIAESSDTAAGKRRTHQLVPLPAELPASSSVRVHKFLPESPQGGGGDGIGGSRSVQGTGVKNFRHGRGPRAGESVKDLDFEHGARIHSTDDSNPLETTGALGGTKVQSHPLGVHAAAAETSAKQDEVTVMLQFSLLSSHFIS